MWKGVGGWCGGGGVSDFGRPERQLRIGCAGSCSGSRAPLAKIACAFAVNFPYSVDVFAWRYIIFIANPITPTGRLSILFRHCVHTLELLNLCETEWDGPIFLGHSVGIYVGSLDFET